MGTSVVRLSNYTEEHDLLSFFLWDNKGGWTNSIEPMMPPSCYTKDHQGSILGSACIRRRTEARTRACNGGLWF
jgi:hypothetical protein